MTHKIILALSLLLAPFFSLAQDSNNIFENGTVDTKVPKMESTEVIISINPNTSSYVGMSIGIYDSNSACINYKDDTDYKKFTFAELIKNFEFNYSVKCNYQNYKVDPVSQSFVPTDTSVEFAFLIKTEFKDISFCPPQGFPFHTSTYFYIDESERCFNPAQADSVDSCNLTDSNEFLSIPVTSSTACFTQDDGSRCVYNSVGDTGNEYYAMDLEGVCYGSDLPNIDGTPQDTPTSENDNCVDWGNSGMICPENPDDVCNMDAQGNTVCQESCGYVNGVYACFDNDLDGDKVPDYLDPDIDGDGVKNEDDLDNDGDGKDDPIDNSKDGNKKGSTTVNVDVDFSGVIKKLDEIKKGQNETSVTTDIEPTEGLQGFWESEYENGLQGVFDEKIVEIKATELFGFLDKFNPSISGGSSANYDMCFNLGSMGNYGCHNFNIDPRTFPAIKIFILITAGFLCRRIIFGG